MKKHFLGFLLIISTHNAFTQTTVTLSPTTLPGATTGQPYNQTLTASGGAPPTYITYQAACSPAD